MIQITLKAGHHRPTSETPFKCRFPGGPLVAPTLNSGLVACDFQEIWTSIAKKPYNFVIFYGAPGPLPHPLWIRA